MRRKTGLALLILALVLADVGLVYWFRQQRLERSQDIPIREAAFRYGVDPALVKAVVWKESRFDPEARGRAGEIGLMQLREAAASEWAAAERILAFRFQDLEHPRTNCLAGTWYLAKLSRRYQFTDNPTVYALADYNAGRTHVLRWARGTASTNSFSFLDSIDYPMTRAYILSVLDRATRYRPSRP